MRARKREIIQTFSFCVKDFHDADHSTALVPESGRTHYIIWGEFFLTRALS